MRRDVLNSPRLTELKKQRRKTVQKKIWILMFGLVAVFSILTYLSRLDNLNIQEIKITGNKVTETQELQKNVEQKISEKYLGIFPKSNILYYPQNALRAELQDKFKRIGAVDFSIQKNKTLEVTVTERTGKYIWCGVVPDQIKEKCYFSDESGYIFDEAPYFSGEVYFKLYGLGDFSADNPMGKYFFQTGFEQLMVFKEILASFDMKPVALYHNSEGDLEFFLTKGSSISVRPKVILNSNADFQIAAKNLRAALDTEPLLSKFKNKYSSLQYIDLRFGNKVYYKFK